VWDSHELEMVREDGCPLVGSEMEQAMATALGRGCRIQIGVCPHQPAELDAVLGHMNTVLAHFGKRLLAPIREHLYSEIARLRATADELASMDLIVAVIGPLDGPGTEIVGGVAPRESVIATDVTLGTTPWARDPGGALAGLWTLSRVEEMRVLHELPAGINAALWSSPQREVVESTVGNLLWKEEEIWRSVAPELKPRWNPIAMAASSLLGARPSRVVAEELAASADTILTIDTAGMVRIVAEFDGVRLKSQSEALNALRRFSLRPTDPCWTLHLPN
jgi:hypothetical protein